MMSFYTIVPTGNAQMISQQKENVVGQHQLTLAFLPLKHNKRTAQAGFLFIPLLSKEETFIINGDAVVR